MEIRSRVMKLSTRTHAKPVSRYAFCSTAEGSGTPGRLRLGSAPRHSEGSVRADSTPRYSTQSMDLPLVDALDNDELGSSRYLARPSRAPAS